MLGLKYTAVCILVTHFVTCGYYALACEGYHGSYGGNCANGSWILTVGTHHEEEMGHGQIDMHMTTSMYDNATHAADGSDARYYW